MLKLESDFAICRNLQPREMRTVLKVQIPSQPLFIAVKQMAGSKTMEKKCVLCENLVPSDTEVSICSSCLLHADCCVGLESLHME
jgi:hypothetical protein